MRVGKVEELSPLLYDLRLGCEECANWLTLSGRLEEVETWIPETLWTAEARQDLDRLPPHISPLVEAEVEAHASHEGRRLITVARVQEARQRGRVSWTPVAQARLANIPATVRSMAKVEIERMAIERGLSEVTEQLMQEAKVKFLGMRA